VLRPVADGIAYQLRTAYRADGAVTSITRQETATDAPGATVNESSQRVFFYDSAGRRLGSTDPDTDDPDGSAGSTSRRPRSRCRPAPSFGP
jgi:hypothetical protein